MARKNAVGTVRFTVSVDPTTDSVLQRMVPLGLHGKNKAEVASWILREWIWHNKADLAGVGVQLHSSNIDGSRDDWPATSPGPNPRVHPLSLDRLPVGGQAHPG